MVTTVAAVLIAVTSVWQPFFYAGAFLFTSYSHYSLSLDRSLPSSSSSYKSALSGGVGVADTYSWKEEQFEIEITIPVPHDTEVRNVKFKCSSEAIDLRLNNNNDEKILLDGTRKMRGKICVDGTFWSIADTAMSSATREITITIEKHFVPVSTIGGQQTYDTLTEFDWGGIYPNDEEEVTHRKYEEPEELNVREYAAKLGVDIDNLDMSKVDKTMFGAGISGENNPLEGTGGGSEENLDSSSPSRSNMKSKKGGFHFNIEQATLDQLTKSGLAKEIVQQTDGREYSLDDETEFSMLGKNILSDELREAGILTDNRPVGSNVPGIWQESSIPVEPIPVEEFPDFQKKYNVDGLIEEDTVEREITGDESISDGDDNESVMSVSTPLSASLDDEDEEEEQVASDGDPIDKLTVAKLKEILKAQGLKTSGTKQILRDRLRNHVDTLLQEE